MNREVEALRAVVGVLREYQDLRPEKERRAALRFYCHYRGRHYVMKLEEAGIPTPERWQRMFCCPPSYLLAWRSDRFRKLIAQERWFIERKAKS